MFILRHIGCGGEVKQDLTTIYTYEDEDGSLSEVASLRCQRCGKEIVGDNQLDIDRTK